MPPSDIDLTGCCCTNLPSEEEGALLSSLAPTQLNSTQQTDMSHFTSTILMTSLRINLLSWKCLPFLTCPFSNFAQIYDVNKFSKLLLLLLLVMLRGVENVCWWCDWFWRQPTATTTTTSKSRPESSLLVSLKALFVIGDLQRLWTTTIEQNQIDWESNLAPFLQLLIYILHNVDFYVLVVVCFIVVVFTTVIIIITILTSTVVELEI